MIQFQSAHKPKTTFGSALAMMEVIYHSIVRHMRKKHNNAVLAMGANILQVLVFVFAFYIMFLALGMRSAAIRGDFLLYIMSGIFLFMTHTKTMQEISTADGPSSAMMQHAPMNTVVAITSRALTSLYLQTLSLGLILYGYHIIVTPIEIIHPFAAYGMLLIAWFSGVAVGLVFLALRPWNPGAVKILTTFYMRANMIASGKMFVANALPSFMLAMFDWNPLFHLIDQARGYTFINYYPRNSSWEYAIDVTLILLIIGMMGEFYTRRHASASWDARR